MSRLSPGTATDAAALPLEHDPVPAEQIVAGDPTTGYATLDESGGAELGVWEMSPGAMSDVEADELFVVLAGDATVEFVDPALPPIPLAPGAVVRLTAGMRTVWTVRETLRKVYLTP
ncbi:cupin domain-containing protein [Microbacterium pumilum]|uniref:Cupin domain-containing protein n=1 Tax=Microbacterium pumilum TaxID=344165 RepID=A0ABP5DN24_9MICO